MKVFLSSTLRKYIKDYDPGKGYEADISAGSTVSDLCRQLKIPLDDISIIMVDCRQKDPDHILKGVERVYLFPPIGGG